MDIPLFEKIDGGLQCLLCPHFCSLSNGQVGKCSARFNNGSAIVHMNLGAISSLAVEPIEKKPFKHFLEGTKTLTVGGYGCNLDCVYCENHKISQVSPPQKSKVIDPVDLVAIAVEKHCQSITMSYNEPILSYEYLLDLAENCFTHELDFILKTNAFVNKDPWEEICLRTFAMNIDWKGDGRSFKDVTRVDDYVLKDRIKTAFDHGVHIEISLPLYYLDYDLEEQINIAGEFLSSIDESIPCHVLRISPSHDCEDFIYTQKDLDISQKILSKYMKNVYTVI